MRQQIPVYEAVLEYEPERFPGYERLLRKKRREYDKQSMDFATMQEDARIADWLSSFSLWDAENEETIHLNEIQRHDLNLILQKRYGLTPYFFYVQNAYTVWCIPFDGEKARQNKLEDAHE